MATPSLRQWPCSLEKAIVLLRVGLRFLVEPLEHALGQHVVQLPHQRAVLHRLARDIQRQILAIDDAAQEAQPLGEEALRRGWMRPCGSRDAPPVSPRVSVSSSKFFCGTKKQRADGERRVGGEVQPIERRLGVVADVLVEVLVFGVGDLAFDSWSRAPEPCSPTLPFSSIGNGTKFE